MQRRVDENNQMMKAKALRGFCLIEMESPEPKTFLHLPDSAKDMIDIPSTGRVVSMSGCRITKKKVRVPNEFKIGDRVVYRKFSGLILERNGSKLIRIPIHDIEAVLG